MSEIRLNLITREWVVIASERAARPDQFARKQPTIESEEYRDDCPFCPGHEDLTPNEISRSPAQGDWEIRVVPNKFSALSKDALMQRTNDGRQHGIAGYGHHEVIIESNKHNRHLALQPLSAIKSLIQTFKDRFHAIYQDPAIEHVTIFKNHGEEAGTSLEHPHSQIIGTPITPVQIRDRLDAGREYFDNTGECLMCGTLKDELRVGTRIILDTEHFLTFIPYAALSPYHTWIFPKRHTACFGDITEEEITDLALHLKNILSKLYIGLDNPAFNFLIRSETPRACNSEYFHWYISIIPRLSKPAGFELGSGMYINSANPEDSADFLNSIQTED